MISFGGTGRLLLPRSHRGTTVGKTLTEKPPEELHLELLLKFEIRSVCQTIFQPLEHVCTCPPIEMTGHAEQLELRRLKLFVAHYRIEVTVTTIPATVISLGQTFRKNLSVHY